MKHSFGVWFPTVRTGTGTDVFTKHLVEGLQQQGVKAEITWIPLRAEYAPWTVTIPQPPDWATIVHVNTWLHSRFLPKDLPVIATLHHSIHDPNLLPYKGWLRAKYHQYWIAPNERRVMQQARQVTAVSQFVSDMANQTLCNVPIQVIYNGIDTEKFIPSKSKKVLNKPFRLLFIGSWMTRKGVDLLAPIMRELGEGFELHYTGGKSAEHAKKTMPNNMYDLGRLNQDEVIKKMQNSDIFLFPSRSEGLPLVVIEAMACGLPTIAFKNTAVSELVTDGINGFLCDWNNINEIKECICKISTNKAFYDQMSESAMKSARNFLNQIMIENYIKAYQLI